MNCCIHNNYHHVIQFKLYFSSKTTKKQSNPLHLFVHFFLNFYSKSTTLILHTHTRNWSKRKKPTEQMNCSALSNYVCKWSIWIDLVTVILIYKMCIAATVAQWIAMIVCKMSVCESRRKKKAKITESIVFLYFVHI